MSKEINILLAEDNDEVRELIHANLEELSIHGIHPKTTEARDGEEAFKYLLQDKYDLIITDLEMPLLDGRELMSLLKKEQTLNFETPIIVISGNVSDLNIQADDEIYTVEKPFDLIRFDRFVRLIIAGHEKFKPLLSAV
jgi:CheY-like chemotaxis protein